MEAMRNRGQTCDDGRLPTRPVGLSGPARAVSDRGFEDFGVTLKPGLAKKTTIGGAKNGSQASSQTQTTAGQTRKFKPSYPRQNSPKSKAKHSPSQRTAGNRSNSISKSTSSQATKRSKGVLDIDSDSADEMDLLSQADYSDDPSTSQRPVATNSKFKPAVSTTAAKPGQKSSFDQKQESKNAKESKGQEPREVYIDRSGKEHDYHPNFPPQKKGKFSGMKINKTKSANYDESAKEAYSKSQEPISKENMFSNAHEPPGWTDGLSGSSSTRKQDKFMDLTSSPKHVEDDLVVYVKHASPLSGKSANSNRRISPSPPRSRQPVPSRKPATSENLPENVRIGPPRGRPKPRPIGRAGFNVVETEGSQPKKAPYGPGSSQTRAAPSLTKVLDMLPVDVSSQRGETIKKRSETPTLSRSRSTSLECSSPRTVRKTRPEEFPALSPPSSPPKPSAFPMMSPLRGAEAPSKSTGHSSKPLASSSCIPRAFPMPSPQIQQREESKAKTYVKPSKEKVDKGKSNAKEASLPSDDDDMDSDYDRENKSKAKQRKPKLKAFPMSTQVLASIGSSDAPSSSRSPFASSRRGKRTSEGGSEDERISKKSRMERNALLESPTRLPFEDEGDSICIAPHVDPSTLCPYCDTCLPSNPTPLLVKILAATKKKAQRDPRPSNPLGLKAPLATFIAVCQRHRFESQILPQAERKGWPKTIKWKEVSGRVLKMKPFLKALIEDPGDDFMAEADSDSWEVVFNKKHDSKKKKKGPKARSIFWTDVIDEVKKKGLRAVSGVRGQFANFEKTQPGYYGELGSVIIHQTLYNMFPPSEMDPALIAPLTSNEVVQRILVPEVALHLIMEDKGLQGDEGMEEALKILRDSSSYGVAMFPEDGGEWGGNKKGEEDKMGVGDLIVMERARKRRKELEEEDEREEEERRLLEEKQRQELEAKERDKRGKTKGTGKQKPELAGDSSEINEVAERPRPRPRPRPLVKDSSSRSVLAGQEPNHEPQIRPSRTRTRSRSTSVRIDNDRRASSEEMRRSPSASASRKPEDMPPVLTRRAPSRGMAGLSLGSDSDTSVKAVVDADRRVRSRSRARSTSVHAKRKEQSSDRMDTADDNDSDDEVEISDIFNTRTPVQRRHAVEIDDEGKLDNTPKAVDATSGLPPLAAARMRFTAQKKQDTGSHGSVAGQSVGAPKDFLTAARERKRQCSTGYVTNYSDNPSDTDEGHKARSAFRKQEEWGWLLNDGSSQ